jgi:hypothetical protein
LIGDIIMSNESTSKNLNLYLDYILIPGVGKLPTKDILRSMTAKDAPLFCIRGTQVALYRRGHRLEIFQVRSSALSSMGTFEASIDEQGQLQVDSLYMN